jgi:plastocyanin domain-containing protein
MKKINILVVLLTLLLSQGSNALSQVKRETKKKGNTAKVKVINILLTEKGFEPDNVKLRVGQPTKLIFMRKVQRTCATEVLLTDYNIKRDLPLNSPVAIEFTPKKTGTLSFSCGMNMIKGSLIVQ